MVGALAGEAPPDLEAVQAHDAVVRRVAAAARSVLPARFGSRFPDEPALRAALARHGAAIREALALVSGCEQMTLRVFGTLPAVRAAGTPGRRYMEERLARRRLLPLDPLRAALAGLVRAERVQDQATPPLLASVFHLVPRGSAARYRRLVRRTLPALAPLRVTPSGPWAPYAFGPEPLA